MTGTDFNICEYIQAVGILVVVLSTKKYTFQHHDLKIVNTLYLLYCIFILLLLSGILKQYAVFKKLEDILLYITS